MDALVEIYQAAQRWLAQQGSDQWAKNSEARVRGIFEDAINRGGCLVAEESGRVVGTATVDEYADPEFWQPEDGPEDALYVHRMVIDREASGRNIGGQLLDFAESLAVDHERKWLRLDAWRTNEKLHDYYRKQGFTHIRTVELPHRGSGALFQRQVDMRRS
ncbi:GNAT family N-acetyltransferase [Catenuloplanes indicus]|uniref:GNAT family N-acetyltransferase n=1 Tax=Catenuloplanes indicus TaxID=137267 RepID=UPI0027D8A815|nr:GNAT family N-acetyltransferase [Catenuloplanes indicus]